MARSLSGCGSRRRSQPAGQQSPGRLTAASSYPFVVGIDFADVAERVPAGDHGLQAGDRVFGMARTHGSYAEYTAAAPGATLEPVARIPDGVTDDQAAALPIPATTALRTIDLLEVTAAQQVVVIGVDPRGRRLRGADRALPHARVIATIDGETPQGSPSGGRGVYDRPASDVIDALRAAHPNGVNAVLDLVDDPDAIRATPRSSTRGRLVSTISPPTKASFSQRQITAHDHASSADPLISPRGLVTVAQMFADGTITARIVHLRPGRRRADAGRLRHRGLRRKAVVRL